MTLQYLRDLPAQHARGQAMGIASVCSAHPVVIEATLCEGLGGQTPVLVEATCNQVNQEGGYTGMTPADFRRFIEAIAAKVGFDSSRIILGGDHLGPNPWKHLPAEEAMAKAETMVDASVRAGFTKIHLDTSADHARSGDRNH
jgi:D-tagatose-bisphosphate aldolase class II non-catalytic subunit